MIRFILVIAFVILFLILSIHLTYLSIYLLVDKFPYIEVNFSLTS